MANKLHSVKEGELKIGSLVMKVHILNDGSRVIEEQGVKDFIAWLGSDEMSSLPKEEVDKFCIELKGY